MTDLATNVQLRALVLCHDLRDTIQIFSYFVLCLKFDKVFYLNV